MKVGRCCFGALSLLGALVLSACEDEDRVERAQWAHEWLETYYAETRLGHGWTVVRQKVSEKLDVDIIVEVPDEAEVRELQGHSGMERLAILRLVCPKSGEKIWKILAEDQQIWIDIRGKGGEKVIAGSCKRS